MTALLCAVAFAFGSVSTLAALLLAREGLVRRLLTTQRAVQVATAHLQDARSRQALHEEQTEAAQIACATYKKMAEAADASAKALLAQASERPEVQWHTVWDKRPLSLTIMQWAEMLPREVKKAAGDAATVKLAFAPPKGSYDQERANHPWLNVAGSNESVPHTRTWVGSPEQASACFLSLLHDPQHTFDRGLAPARREAKWCLYASVTLQVQRPTRPTKLPDVLRVEVPVVETRVVEKEVVRTVFVDEAGELAEVAADELLDAKVELAVDLALTKRIGSGK